MANFPKIKKKIKAFLSKEEGKISKQSLLKVGTVLGAIALGSIVASKGVSAAVSHSNSLSLGCSGGTATATHAHHASHSSY